MRKRLIASILLICSAAFASAAPASDFTVSDSRICIDNNDFEVVRVVAGLFSDDVKAVCGRDIPVMDWKSCRGGTALIFGTVGQSEVIDRMVASGKIDVSGIRGRWECYQIEIVKNPLPGIGKALVVAGSDRRGTAYGIFSLSKKMGVSPWYWWADVPVRRTSKIILSFPTKYVSKEPSVKYRGLFINDEDWGLHPWAGKTFDPEYGDIGPKTYAKICELLLRLNANYLSPAMHGCTKAFNYYPENKVVADRYGIVMGSTHCEPLLFNNASEWDRKTMGDWNYLTNKDGINAQLDKRVAENGCYENVYTLAMRGIHDAVMAGNLPLGEQPRVLERAFDDQRAILGKHIGKPASEIPQVFFPYKEVLDIYEEGMDLPDDVTIIWSDDDFGYIKRLSNKEEQKRSGRSGVYYHLSYWGPPRNYLWINTTPPALMYSELSRAYRATADRLWVANIGDIKPAEYALDLFLAMAYDIEAFSFDNILDHGVDFLCGIFGEQFRNDFAFITREYYNLAFSFKPEYMDRHADTPYSVLNYREAEIRQERYLELAKIEERIMRELPEEYIPAYYQLVHYPYKGSQLLNCMTLSAQQQRFHASRGFAEAMRLRDLSNSYADSLVTLTEGYNSLLDGKWNRMMSLAYGGARSFERGMMYECMLAPGCRYELVMENDNGSAVQTLPEFSSLTPAEHYFDVCRAGETVSSWKASASESWIRLDRTAGEGLYKDRVNVSIDWDSAPSGKSSACITVSAGEQKKNVYVSVTKHDAGTAEGSVFIEDNGVVVIDPCSYTGKFETEDIKFRKVDGLGFDDSVMMLGDPFAATPYQASLVLVSNYVASTGNRQFPCLEYEFYTTSSGYMDVYTYMLPVFPVNGDEGNGSRYGVMVDNSPVYLPESSAPYYSTLWIQSVLRNCRINKTTHFVKSPGRHTLKIYAVHPGMMIQKIVVDAGGLKQSHLGPQMITK
ncbi:MAG: glycosyl hydrolase 115 family protein [Candidatus Cryptobacteroides sp.]